MDTEAAGAEDSPLIHDAGSSTSTSKATRMGWTWTEIQEFIAALAWGLVGWYIPYYTMFPTKERIMNRTIPYQTIDDPKDSGNNAVILDFTINKPLVDPPTISSFVLIQASVFVPIFIILIISYLRRRPRRTKNNGCVILLLAPNNNNNNNSTSMHKALCSLGSSIGWSEGITQTIKFWILRRRPNFYSLCQFDVAQKICTAEPFSRIVEAQLSFPSGHSSLAFSAMTVLVWWFYHYCSKIMSTSPLFESKTNGKGTSSTTVTTAVEIGSASSKSNSNSSSASTTSSSIWALVQSWACFSPWLWALFVAMTRLQDNWHHPSDVIAGSLLGIMCGTISYHIHHQFNNHSYVGADVQPSESHEH